jgi:Asp-tRNA(Asn)/Glu-tRNA(Gln) amidotransferase A subunit family amidase
MNKMRTIVEPYELTATEARKAVNNRDISIVELAESCLRRIWNLEAKISAWIYLDEDLVLDQAKRLDKKLKSGKGGLLCGIPVGVKDVYNTQNMPTCMGSPIWAGFTPGNDARAVESLRWEDALIMGKTVTAEFAVHYPGKTVNPHNFNHYPGTSSSGSAAAVASSMVPVALGTQTAGSTTRPASYCGVFGFKPSFGLIPRTGILKTLDTLDHVTFFARCVSDLGLVLDTLRVKGLNYPYVHTHMDDHATRPFPEKWRVGFVKTPVWYLAEDYVKEELGRFSERLNSLKGVEVLEVDLPRMFHDVHDVHELIYTKALSYYFGEEYENHRDLVSPVMQRMIERGRTITTEAYYEGLKRQNELAGSLDSFFENFDILLSHSTAGVAPEGLHCTEKKDPCLIWTLCRIPSINLPVFSGPKNLPFGAQLVTRRYQDYRLLGFCDLLESEGLLTKAPYPPL